jgi:hypothetical protein
MVGGFANSARDELFVMSRGSDTAVTGNICSLLDTKIIDIQVQNGLQASAVRRQNWNVYVFIFSIAGDKMSNRHRTVMDICNHYSNIFSRKEINFYFNRR